MESAIAMGGLMSAATETPQVRRQQMPLTFLKSGEDAQVLKVRGSGEIHHHLENLGFVPGTKLRVASEQSGNLIIEIKGARIALDKTAASKVITC